MSTEILTHTADDYLDAADTLTRARLYLQAQYSPAMSEQDAMDHFSARLLLLKVGEQVLIEGEMLFNEPVAYLC